jgi:hypothetical protein
MFIPTSGSAPPVSFAYALVYKSAMRVAFTLSIALVLVDQSNQYRRKTCVIELSKATHEPPTIS